MKRRVALGLLGGAAVSLSTCQQQQTDAQQASASGSNPPYLGLNVGTELNWQSWRDQLLPLYQSMGAKWLRVWYNWNSMEPQPGQYGDPATLNALRLAKSQGFRILFVIWGTPNHAGNGSLADVPNARSLTDYCRWLKQNLRGVVDAWEIGNEPNLQDYFLGTPAEYVQTLATAYRELRNNGLVIAAGPSGASTPHYWQSLLDSGLTRSCDRVNLHPYRNQPEQVIQMVDSFRSLTRKPLWITELGLSSAVGGEDAKADFTARMLPLLANRAEKVFWYRSIQGRGLHPLEFGLIEADRQTGKVSPLPAYDAYAAYARQL